MTLDREELLGKLRLPAGRLEEINSALFSADMRVMNDFLDVVEKYGSPEQINRQAETARQLPALLEHVRVTRPAYLAEPFCNIMP